MIDPERIIWHSGAGNPYSFYEIVEEIKAARKTNEFLELHIGTDSDPNGKKYAISTGIALRNPGKGGNYFWSRSFLNPKFTSNIGVRLEREVTDSLIVAEELKKMLNTEMKIVIHVDCNTQLNHASGKYAKQLTSYAVGMGYLVKIKPDSWAASSLADKHAKSYVLPNSERD